MRRDGITLLILGFLSVVTASVAAAAQPELPAGAVAVVGGETITVQEFVREMELRGGEIPGQFATVEQRAELLEAMVEARALRIAASKAGFATHPDVIAVCERAMVSTYLTERLEAALEAVDVSAEEVAAHYQAHRADYARPERLRAAIVFIAVPMGASDELWKQRRARAEEALAAARKLPDDVEHFGSVATTYSDDQTSRYRGGVIGWIVRHPERQYRWDDAVLEAIYGLSEDGAFGPVVRTDDGFYLVRLVRHEPSEARPLEDVRDGIRHQLLQSKRNEIRAQIMGEVMQSAGVAMDLALLESVEPPAGAAVAETDKAPPRLPGR